MLNSIIYNYNYYFIIINFSNVKKTIQKCSLKNNKNNYIIDSLTDDQLLELANYYITTDESLDRFMFKSLINQNEDNNLLSEKINKIKDKIEFYNLNKT